MRLRLRSLPQHLRTAARTARMALRGRAVILLYHRVASPLMDPLLLCVSPQHFSEHLEVLRREYRLLPLTQLADTIRAGDVPDQSVAITFDDGFADNLDTAAPILKANGIAATIFAAGACLTDAVPVSSELENILFHSRSVPQTLSVGWRGKQYSWDMGEWSQLPAVVPQHYYSWNLEQSGDPTPRHRAFREIFRLLRPLDFSAREEILMVLRRQITAEKIERLLMTSQQLRMASDQSGLEIGAHTRRHLVLRGLDAADQQEEILAGKQQLESALGHPVTTFAYPYGSPWDVSNLTVTLARNAGFSLACANTPAPVDRETDPFWLPRFLVRDWSGEEFATRLTAFFHPRAEIQPQS